MNEEEKLIQDQFNKLPPELQKAIEAVPWKSSLKEISLLHHLSPEQAENFERETMFILYGFDDPKSYIDNLKRETKLDEEIIENMAVEVAEKILKPIGEKVETSKESPILITKETKEEALKELEARRINAESISSAPQAIHNNLPMVEEGEKVHDVPSTNSDQMPPIKVVEGTPPSPQVKVPEPGFSAPVPKYGYPEGIDPYREPLA